MLKTVPSSADYLKQKQRKETTKHCCYRQPHTRSWLIPTTHAAPWLISPMIVRRFRTRVSFPYDRAQPFLSQSSVGTRFTMGPSVQQYMKTFQMELIIEMYRLEHLLLRLIIASPRGVPPSIVHLHSAANIHEHLILHGRRIIPSTFKGSTPNSIVQAQFNGRRRVGEVKVIISHIQPVPGREAMRKVLLGVQWFKEDVAMDKTPWDP